MDMSSFIRAALIYFDEHRPVLMFPPVGKRISPEALREALEGGENRHAKPLPLTY